MGNNGFKLGEISTKEYKIMSAKSGKVADIEGWGGPGTAISQYVFNNTTNQQWFFDEIDDDPGYFKIYSTLGTCIECDGINENSQVIAGQWQENGKDSQKWRIIKDTDEDCSCFKIQNKVTHMVIAVQNASLNNGDKLVCCSSHGNDNEKWFITPIDK